MGIIKDTLGFGGSTLTSMKSYGDVKDLLNLAFELDIRHFDTAFAYGRGYSELIFGEFLKNKRKDITVATKFGLGDFEKQILPLSLLLPLNYHIKRIKSRLNKTHIADNTAHIPLVYRKIDKKDIELSLSTSLKRLKTDYIDYYFLHEGLPHFLTEEALNFLLTRKKQGQIRFLGIASNILEIKALTNKEVEDWDVLQYEGRDTYDASSIIQKFPHKIHFHHSCVAAFGKQPQEQTVGHRLAQCVLNNLQGKIIFSTRHEDYLRTNISEFLKTVHENALH
jgi:aryl-alcohol dehydrogenase-like predicted oxidoreductase